VRRNSRNARQCLAGAATMNPRGACSRRWQVLFATRRTGSLDLRAELKLSQC
jgi:hypothetical protein